MTKYPYWCVQIKLGTMRHWHFLYYSIKLTKRESMAKYHDREDFRNGGARVVKCKIVPQPPQDPGETDGS